MMTPRRYRAEKRSAKAKNGSASNPARRPQSARAGKELIKTLEQFALDPTKSATNYVHVQREIKRPQTAGGSRVGEKDHRKIVEREVCDLLAALDTCVEHHGKALQQRSRAETEQETRNDREILRSKYARLNELRAQEEALKAHLRANTNVDLADEAARLRSSLNAMSRSWEHKRALKKMQKQTWDLQNRCENLTRKHQELSLFVNKKLPKETKMLQREEEQQNALVAEAEARVASLEAEFAELERQERRGENLTALAIQAWYRGARVRRIYNNFLTARKHLKAAGTLQCRKLCLHLSLIADLLVSRDAISRALQMALSCQHCFQPYEDPVWIVTDLETASYCRTCAKAVGEESRARTNKECTFVRNSLVATLQERLEAKEVAFREAGEALERQRRELMIHEGFESLIRKELPAEHLFERLVLAGILEDDD